jgi:hypothetical protein
MHPAARTAQKTAKHRRRGQAAAPAAEDVEAAARAASGPLKLLQLGICFGPQPYQGTTTRALEFLHFGTALERAVSGHDF